MRDILEYTSYRQYIADYYAERKAKSAFTWQEFASLAGFSSSIFLKYVSEGRYNLGEATAARSYCHESCGLRVRFLCGAGQV